MPPLTETASADKSAFPGTDKEAEASQPADIKFDAFLY